MDEKNTPKKYQKHRALVLLGLKTQDELDRDLTRFNSRDIDTIKATIMQRIRTAKVPTSYLMSLIRRDECKNLPNCVISSEEDFEKLEELIKSDPGAVEVWAFPKERNAAIGRFAINNDPATEFYQTQIVEQVWSTNHRDIEHYSSKTKVPFISASRTRWNARYSVDRFQNIPESERNTYNKDFIEAILSIERRREKIEAIEEFFRSLGIDSFSLEYRIDSRGFSFIDWDTNRDEVVLNNLFPAIKPTEKGIEDNAR